MTFEEWVKIYEAKTGDKHVEERGVRTIWDERRGYAQFMLDSDRRVLTVIEVCGDGRYWYNFAVEFCREHNVPLLCTTCTRKILPYIRSWGGKITKKEIQPERHNGYKIEGITDKGMPFHCWPRWWDESKQRNAYYLVVEVLK